MLLVTGGAGFIGSNLVNHLSSDGHNVVVLDKMTYAANKEFLAEGFARGNVELIEGSIEDKNLMAQIFRDYQIEAVINIAAESHVDNSIQDSEPFLQTNFVGTCTILSETLKYWESVGKPDSFRFLHVSTDEVFGSLSSEASLFTENSPYCPNSPYSASKAANDHFMRAWFKTYKLPCIITNCSNNFGPHQHEEKLIPTVIRSALSGQKTPVYGSGENVRDWLYVEDHCLGLIAALQQGKAGETYYFGGDCELKNIELVQKICTILDHIMPHKNNQSYSEMISFVEDRKGHDWRYAVNASKAKQDLNWNPLADFDLHLKKHANIT